MAKTTVADFIAKFKRRVDYDITDSDLDNLMVDIIDDQLKILYQWLSDEGLFIDIGTEVATAKTTADQEYIDLSTILADMGDIIQVSERVNDSIISMIPFNKFREIQPDPTAESARTPDYCAILDDKLYLAPTPSDTDDIIYIDYVKIPAIITTASTLPYKSSYDPLLLAMCKVEFFHWQDPTQTTTLTSAIAQRDYLKEELIEGSNKYNMIQQSESRMGGASISPRVPE